MMRLLIASLLVISATAMWANLEQPIGYSYEQYLIDFGKSYDGSNNASEIDARRAIFEQVKEMVHRHNTESGESYSLAVNHFADMFPHERKQWMGHSASMARTLKAKMPLANLPNITLADLPTSVDWRTKGIISPVKNQGSCGSCWAFAAVETIEAVLTQATGKKLLLSPQDMVSCTKNPQHCGGTGGCNGATSELGYEYVHGAGIASEADYPYRAQTGVCDPTKRKSAHIGGYVKLPENDYTALLTAIATVGPIAVSVDAEPMQFYSRGIFTGCRFQRVVINHAVQLVGYGTEAGKDFWIIRNSWGGGWGEQGYIRLERHSDGDKSKWCAPDPNPKDGTGCDGGPSQVTVCGSCGIWYDSSYPTGASLL